MAGKGCISLRRADKILTHIAHVGAASFTQLQKDFDLPKSSLLNILDTMVECGLLIKNDARQYQSARYQGLRARLPVAPQAKPL